MQNKDYKHNTEITTNLKASLSEYFNIYDSDKIYVLCDENTHKFCLPEFVDMINSKNVLKIKSGEEQKNINTLQQIWTFLQNNKANRESLLLNLGGGVISDIGGFAANTFKRGIDFINIPTTLLSQIDASIGGKNGINYANLKNEIGTFKQPEKIIIYTDFLKTLNTDEFFSGYAEMIKHALISDEAHLNELFSFMPEKDTKFSYDFLNILIQKSIKIKEKFISQDIDDKGIRRALNFGHTFGHAFESFLIDSGKSIKHGNAVAQGMICELFLSNQIYNFNLKKFLYISDKIFNLYDKIKFDKKDIQTILKYMKADKKNSDDKINSSLIKTIGEPVVNCKIEDKQIEDTLLFYYQLSK